MKNDRVVLIRNRIDSLSDGPGRSAGFAKGAGSHRFIVCTSRDMMLGLLIVVILLVVATPHYVAARKSAMAARIICDFNMISAAAMAAYSEIGELPPNGGWGNVPGELVPYLPARFEFKHNNVSYRWRRWCLPTGLPERPEQKVLLGVQVRTQDARLLDAVLALYRGRISQLRERQITLVIL